MKRYAVLLKETLEVEYQYALKGLAKEKDFKHRQDIWWSFYQRALGASDMAFACGLDNRTADLLVLEYLERLEKIM